MHGSFHIFPEKTTWLYRQCVARRWFDSGIRYTFGEGVGVNHSIRLPSFLLCTLIGLFSFALYCITLSVSLAAAWHGNPSEKGIDRYSPLGFRTKVTLRNSPTWMIGYWNGGGYPAPRRHHQERITLTESPSPLGLTIENSWCSDSLHASFTNKWNPLGR